jgi:hypothetical protein
MRSTYPLYFLLLFSLLSIPAVADMTVVAISNFKERSLSDWQEKLFAGKTNYEFVQDAQKGWVLQATSDGSASGLWKEESIDIDKTPYLNWSWRVDTLPKVKDEKTKDGDDYSARVHVIFKSGLWFWNTKALNYVWNYSYPQGESWDNAFTGNARMIALQSSKTPLGVWITEKRNIQKDILDCFGLERSSIDAIAIMTDSDNSKSEAVAYYGDIYFSDE